MTSRANLWRSSVAVAAVLTLLGWTAVPAAADSVRDRQWYLSALKVSEAHRTTQGSGVTIGLIDSGVDAKHRDLAGAVAKGRDFVDGKGDGRADLNGHGTAMAGIIAGRGHGRGSGILGIAPAARILPLSTTSDFFADSDEMRNALNFAADHGARVINMSFGSGDDVAVHEAIRAAQARDIVLVASSGNRGDADEGYPGKYPEVLTVGAVGRDGRVADFSVTGPQVDLTAPGVDITTTSIYGSGYSSGNGTSQATAIVSGAAALVRARYPDLSAAEVVHRLTATATDAGKPGRDDTYGYGRLNLLKALTADVPAAGPSKPAGENGAAAPPRAPDAGAGPRRVSPLLVGGVAVGGVLLLGALVVGLMVAMRRRRP